LRLRRVQRDQRPADFAAEARHRGTQRDRLGAADGEHFNLRKRAHRRNPAHVIEHRRLAEMLAFADRLDVLWARWAVAQHFGFALPEQEHALANTALLHDDLAELEALAPHAYRLVHFDAYDIAADDRPDQPVDKDAKLAIEGRHEPQEQSAPR